MCSPAPAATHRSPPTLSQENALSPEEASDLLRALVSAAMERRLLPVARVPIEGTTLEARRGVTCHHACCVE